MFKPDQYGNRRANHQVSIRFTEDEYHRLKESADEFETSLNNFILACCSYSLENLSDMEASPEPVERRKPQYFAPEKYIRKKATHQTTVRFTDDLFDQLQTLADVWDMPLNQFVPACCRYALENMEQADAPNNS